MSITETVTEDAEYCPACDDGEGPCTCDLPEEQTTHG